MDDCVADGHDPPWRRSAIPAVASSRRSSVHADAEVVGEFLLQPIVEVDLLAVRAVATNATPDEQDEQHEHPT